MKASDSPPIECTTDKIFTMLGINTQGGRNGIQEDMLNELEGIRHFNDEDAERIHAACRGCANITLANGRFVVTRVNVTILTQQNRKEHFIISPQQNGKEHFTISPQKMNHEQ